FVGAGEVGLVAGAAPEIGAATVDGVFVRAAAVAFPVSSGLFALALFAFLAAPYLTVDADEDGLRDDFRARALLAAGLVFVCALAALLLARSAAPRLAMGIAGA